jgi:hypothetical protein
MANRANKPKDVVFSKIYINLLNELVFHSLLIQLLIVGAYFAIKHVAYSEFRGQLRATYDELVLDTQQGALLLQKSNLMAQSEDRIDLLHLHTNLINASLLSDLAPTSAPIMSLTSGGRLADLGFYVDQQPDASFASLSTDAQERMLVFAAVLGQTKTNFAATGDGAWIKAVALSMTIEDQYVTVIKVVGERSVDLSALFQYVNICSQNKVCLDDCSVAEKIRFSCIASLKGASFSPLRLSDDEDDNKNMFVYTTDAPEEIKVTFFFLIDPKTSKETLKSPFIQAVILNNASKSDGTSVPVVQFLGFKKLEDTSQYLLDPFNSNHTTVISTWLKNHNGTNAEIIKNNENWLETPFSSASMWGHQVFGMTQLAEKVFKNLSYQTEEEALSTDFIEHLIMIALFTLNFLSILGWVFLTEISEKYNH